MLTRTHRVRLAVIAVLLLLAAGLRFHNLEVQSLWNDEGNSARIAERPIAATVEGAAGDIHPPGYYLLLAGWRALAGQSEFALRMLSALAGVLAVAVVAAIGRDLFERWVGAIGALLAAISPFQVYYGQEARMYALVALLAALSIWLTAKVLSLPGEMITGRFDRRRAAGILGAYILTNVAGLYTHYSFPLILAAESLVFLIWLARRVILSNRQLRLLTLFHGLAVWAIVHGLALLLFAPWIPHAIRQISSWPRGTADAVGVAALFSTLAYGVTLSTEAARLGLIPLLILVGLGLLPPVRAERRYLRFAERIGLVAAWLVIPVLALGLAGMISGPALKFLLPSNLALGLLAARGWVVAYDLTSPDVDLAKRQNPLAIQVFLLPLLLGALPVITALSNLYANPAYARDNYRAIAQRILSEAGPDAAVILDAPNQWEVFTYYYPDGPNVAPLPNDSTGATLDRLLADHGRIYVLYWGEGQQDPQGLIRQTLEANALEAGSEWYGGVRLVTYAVTGGPAASMESFSGTLFGDPPAIMLDGFTLNADRAAPGYGLGVTLFWHAEAPLEARYKVFVHLYAPDGALVAQHDSEPGGGTAPTDAWAAGETVVDAHGLLLPLDLPPGVYRLVVGLYGMEDGARLPVTDHTGAARDSVALADLRIEQP